jgi:hypothetical protein
VIRSKVRILVGWIEVAETSGYLLTVVLHLEMIDLKISDQRRDEPDAGLVPSS